MFPRARTYASRLGDAYVQLHALGVRYTLGPTHLTNGIIAALSFSVNWGDHLVNSDDEPRALAGIELPNHADRDVGWLRTSLGGA